MKIFILKNFKNILLGCCFLMTVLNVTLAIVFNNALHTGNSVNNDGANTNFIVSLNEDYNKSSDMIKTQMLSSIGTDKDEKTDIVKKLIKEYLVERYTVVLHKDLSAQKFMSVGGDIKEKQSIMISPRVSKVMLMGHGFNQTMPATKDYITKDAKEYSQLMSENTTRSVQIISEPRKTDDKKDEWITRVKFVYKTPNIDSIKDAKTEIYDINMVLQSGDDYGNFINNAEFIRAYYPANVFNFTMIYLDKKFIK